METLKAISTRRSIRQFTSQEISEDLVEKILRAAMQAPSARNYQPWQFIITNDRTILDKIPQVHPYAEMMVQAALAILVCGDLKLEKSVEYCAVNCSAATQNILLAAHDLGLGAVWLGIYPREERIKGLKNLFNLPDHIIPISLIACGHPAEKLPAEERFKKERIHRNKW
jgi:nitroreductase